MKNTILTLLVGLVGIVSTYAQTSTLYMTNGTNKVKLVSHSAKAFSITEFQGTRIAKTQWVSDGNILETIKTYSGKGYGKSSQQDAPSVPYVYYVTPTYNDTTAFQGAVEEHKQLIMDRAFGTPQKTIPAEVNYNYSNSKPVFVRDYYRKDGTHVNAHFRSRPSR